MTPQAGFKLGVRQGGSVVHWRFLCLKLVVNPAVFLAVMCKPSITGNNSNENIRFCLQNLMIV